MLLGSQARPPSRRATASRASERVTKAFDDVLILLLVLSIINDTTTTTTTTNNQHNYHYHYNNITSCYVILYKTYPDWEVSEDAPLPLKVFILGGK